MGICSSCESPQVATAKLILQDGRLQEFSYPVKVSCVLQTNPTFFICNADEMEFGDVVSAVDGEDELQLGQLYFALPLSRLKRRLQAEEMAALAVKANYALMKSGDKCRRCRMWSSPAAFSVEENGKSYGRIAAIGIGCGGNGGGARRRRDGGRKFAAILSEIPE